MADDRSFHVIEVVADRLEGAPRRVRREWSEAFKTQIVAETLMPGANVSAIARRTGISPSQLFGWRRQAIHNGTVAPVDALGGSRSVAVDAAVSSPLIEIIIDGVVVRAGTRVSDEHLRRVIRVVRSA